MEDIPVVELRGITKRFGSVVANDAVNLEIYAHEILSVLGENGSGKTTLMNILSGIYRPDEGQIFVHGKEVRISSPRDALSLKIGMIHQHYRLVNVFTAAENIILGLPGPSVLDMDAVEKDIRAIIDTYGFELDLHKKIYEMSVSQKQTVEIVKALYRGADVLILDEPTAVLTPQETEKLFAVLHNMKAGGKSVIIITHKLQEVLDVSDRVTVLRRGKNAGTLITADCDMSVLIEKMVGERISLDIQRTEPVHPQLRLKVENVTCRHSDGRLSLHDVSFTA
ncbi:MAG: ATP-binding cassette domain-containing protein, partial [Treponema sp.]